MDVVLQDFDETILVSARIELNDRKFREHHELSDTFEFLQPHADGLGNQVHSDTSGLFHPVADLTYSSVNGHRLESRMREIRLSGSEGGGALTGSPYPYRGVR